MEFGKITRFLTGVAIPVFSLRTKESCGIGEFLDLVTLGTWCKETGLDLIQILPVNDTGNHPSPYSAQSAFALNPVYIRLQEIDGMGEFHEEIMDAQSAFEKETRIHYLKIARFKLSMLHRFFSLHHHRIRKSKRFHSWISDNPWLKNYCVYCALKDFHKQRSWKEWDILRNPTHPEIERYWREHKKEVLFYAWGQYHLEAQLKNASLTLEEKGLRLKGDIPILINEDSADVWGERNYFDLKKRAGAPPDMFSKRGQNWGFPCYNWEQLEKDEHRWWRDRLRQASKFYHAYRIDHVLGFFRIWQVPEKEATGILGHFNPAVPISKLELEGAGFSHERINTFLSPQFTKSRLKEYFGEPSERLINHYFQVAGEESSVLTFSQQVSGEKYIFSLDEDTVIKDKLLRLYWNRVFIPVDEGTDAYLPSWFFDKTGTFHHLSEDEQMRLRGIIDKNWVFQDDVWRENGLKLLRMMCNTTDMLVCAEDLGVIPSCVPEVLAVLGILGLKVERWTREYHRESEPYIDPKHYTRLSICSPSLHDTSTLRGWWDEKNWDHEQYFSLLHMPGECPQYLTTELSERIIRRNLHANSVLCIFLLHDLLGLYYNLRTSYPDEERINVPGTVSSTNWSYRMKDSIEFLIDYDEYNHYLRSLIEERRKRPLIE